MFTFGREHEKKCGQYAVRNAEQAKLLLDVIDAVHDLLEGAATEEPLIDAIRIAMIDGKSGVWEGAGKWLRMSSYDYPKVVPLWVELASHPKAEVRFRIACFLDEVPTSILPEVAAILVCDKSKKVATMAKSRTGIAA